MRRLTHFPLESYPCRYTEYLADWETKIFSTKFDLRGLVPSRSMCPMPINIGIGEVLDSVGRSLWSASQWSLFLQQAPSHEVVYFSDFFTPGLETLPYSRIRYSRVASFLWAQTFDQHDFTTGFLSWMRPWELMALDIYDDVFVAHPLLADFIATAAPSYSSKLRVVGLPFNSTEVSLQWDKKWQPEEDNYHAVYSSRFDTEKNPGLFLDLVELFPQFRFVICTGHPALRGTDTDSVRRAKRLVEQPGSNLSVYAGLTKAKYYRILMASHCQINTSWQDWVSFTLLEALTYGCLPLYPNHRSFPDTLAYNPDWLYIPNDLDSLANKFEFLMGQPRSREQGARQSIVNFHDGTLTRIADILNS